MIVYHKFDLYKDRWIYLGGQNLDHSFNSGILGGKWDYSFDNNFLINSHGRMLLFGRNQDAFLELHMNMSSYNISFTLQEDVGYLLIPQVYDRYPFVHEC